VGKVEEAAPQLAATMRRYLAQVATFPAPRSVDVADRSLRQLARWIVACTGIESAAEICRDDVEGFKLWLASQRGIKGTLSANTHRQRLRTLRAFFDRTIDWDWADARPATPSSAVTSPKAQATAEVP
jgi:site-specific recombinase XerD